MTTKRIKTCQKLSSLAKQSEKFSYSCIPSPIRAMSPKLELNLTFKKDLQKWVVVMKLETSCLSCELLSALSVSNKSSFRLALVSNKMQPFLPNMQTLNWL
jgi:hypothetical protein